jgi:hypothetical protein
MAMHRLAARSCSPTALQHYAACPYKFFLQVLKVHAAPVGSPWMWTLAFGYHEDRTPTHGYADGDGGVREELASGLSDVLFMQQIIRKANHGALKNPFVV